MKIQSSLVCYKQTVTGTYKNNVQYGFDLNNVMENTGDW